jgi:hypothetical protein
VIAVKATEPLVCPRCATTHPLEARFCPSCRMPLVYSVGVGVDAEVTEAQARARKVKPQYAEGDLVRVASGRNQAEAEFIQGLLLEEGVPSLLRRSAGFDVPDFLAAGPRDVLVPASGVATAREVLLESELLADAPASGVDPPWRLFAGVVGAFAVVAGVAWLVSALAG